MNPPSVVRPGRQAQFTRPRWQLQPLVLGNAPTLRASPASLRIDRCWQLVPEFDLVTVGIGGKDVWLTGYKLALLFHAPAGLLHGLDGASNVGGAPKPETEVGNPARRSSALSPALKHDDVARARGLELHEGWIGVNHLRTQ